MQLKVSSRLKFWGSILVWSILFLIITVISSILFEMTGSVIWILLILIWFWLPFAILGTIIALKPHEAIDNNLQMRERMMKFFGIEEQELDVNPHGKFGEWYYRSIGISFVIITGLPIVVILLTAI